MNHHLIYDSVRESLPFVLGAVINTAEEKEDSINYLVKGKHNVT